MSTPVNPLAGIAPALRTFRTNLARGGDTLRALTARVRSAATATDRIRSAADQAAGAVRRTKTDADATARSLTRAGRSAGTAATGVKSFGTRAKGATRALGRLKGGGLLALIGGLVGAAGILGTLLGAFGTAMTIGSGVMTAINVITRANPLGFVLGLLLPVAGWLLDLAMNSEAGQRIMKAVGTVVLKYVQLYLAILTPLLKAIATAVSTYVTVYLTVITTAIKVVGALIGTGFAVLKALTTGDTRALRDKVSSLWKGFKSTVKPVLDWITRDIPRMFGRVKDATSSTLGALGKFVTTGAQTVAGVIKGPINGLIAFANWVIDGLNSLSVNILGKKFGVDLDKIPMLAEGGVVVPGASPRAGRVLPLTALHRRQRALDRRHRATAARRPHHIKEFHESRTAGVHGNAEDLLFLAAAHACP
ncbi:tape-measure protein [Streptomyces sp. NPDC018693]|uniref:tape-measure protein n=1 Tax=unclassified Streptomyces TaxID=2593676 RepID=UPI003794F8A5